MMLQKRSLSGQSGEPSYMTPVTPSDKRTVDDVAVTGDPADVGGAPPDVVVFQIEDVLRRRDDPGQIAAGRVDDALRLARRAGRVKDVEHVLGVHRLGLARTRRRRP